MDAFLTYLGYAAKIVTMFTLKRVLIFALSGFLSLGLYTAYEQRVRVLELMSPVSSLPTSKRFVLSSEMEGKIRDMVTRNVLIVTVAVLSTDLKINERHLVFKFSDDELVNDIWEKQSIEKLTAGPLFTRDEVNNARMVSLVNGVFICSSERDIPEPEFSVPAPTTCRVSLPPYYGEIAGYVALSLSKIPTPEEAIDLEREVKRLASEIYFKNILNR